jgi:hypothetical protein
MGNHWNSIEKNGKIIIEQSNTMGCAWEITGWTWVCAWDFMEISWDCMEISWDFNGVIIGSTYFI